MDFHEILTAIERRLGMPADSTEVARGWDKIESWLRADPERLQEAAGKLAEPLIQILRWRLLPAATREDERSAMSRRWADLNKGLGGPSDLPSVMAVSVAVLIESGLRAQNARTVPLAPLTETEPMESAPEIASAPAAQTIEGASPIGGAETEMNAFSPGKDSLSEQTPTNNTMKEESEASDDEVTIKALVSETTPAEAPPAVLPASPEAPTSQDESSQTSQSSQWKYLEVPEGPAKHTEFYEEARTSPEGLSLIGARARGKKHKHEGTNCDDWFEFDVAEKWTIIAVSDGAGSKTFSRIGAKESCKTALHELTTALGDFVLKARDEWSGDGEGKKEIFVEEDLQLVRNALHRAMQKAYDAVAAKAEGLIGNKAYSDILGGRDVVIEDLSGTLLLAVHTTVTHEGKDYSFVMTCQIGDGMLAVVDGNGGLTLMGVPDSGEFAGQTDFLTSKKKLEPGSLASRTFSFFGSLKALLVMSDGVADDYFPNNPGMLRLYGDLALNGILRLGYPKGTNLHEMIDASLANTKLPSTQAVAAAQLATQVEAITATGPQPVMIRSIESYAEQLGLPVADVVKSAPRLIAGAMRISGQDMSPDPHTPAEELLRVWIDCYHVRGSFDDRTLVVLYREVAS